jgi:phosphatidylinositol 4-kinase
LHRHADPFYGKQEFAATDKESLSKRQQQIYNLIAPHFRLLQFLSSHFSASRLSKPDVERVYVRLIHVTLDAASAGCAQPLAREAYFHIILLGLKIARHCTTLADAIKSRLLGRILTAGLAWFAQAPQWSFGGNRLQIKAETHVLADVQTNLDALGKTFEGGAKLKAKQELLSLLIANEQSRLLVWLFPLDHAKKSHFTLSSNRAGLPDVSVTLHTDEKMLTMIDGGECAPQDSMGGEPRDCGASCQALPVCALEHRSSLAGAQFPSSGVG